MFWKSLHLLPSFPTADRSPASMSSTSNPSFTNPKSCPHLSSYRQNHGLFLYKSLQNSNPTCSSCPNPSITPLYLCLICSTISCSRHASCHSISSPGHDISVDVDRAELFCFSCNDQVYDPDFDASVVRRRRRRRGLRHPLGLRGLNNLGNTCFMNSVLQALLHTPPLRSYFLGDLHRREVCRQRKRTRGDLAAAGGGDGNCLACVVEGVFLDVFSGDRKPYSPARFLYRLDVDNAVGNCKLGDDFGFLVRLKF